MNFLDLISTLEIESYPEKLKEIYDGGMSLSDFDESAIDALDSEYSVVGECKVSLKECLAHIRKDEALWKYTCAAAAYLPEASHPDGFELILPKVDTEYPLCYYSALLLVMALPKAIKNYLNRGFTKEEAINIYSAIKSRINSSKSGLNAQGYNWLRHYTSSVIFKTSMFSVTPRRLRYPVILLKNNLGEYKIMMTRGKIHRSGKIFGSAGYTDEDGSFDAEFSEDENFYTGHEVIDAKVSKNATALRKSEWRAVVKEGDGFAGIHIPRGADLTCEKMEKSFKEALEIAKERYPDYNIKAVHCSTWLLEPRLCDILGPNSKITGFNQKFLKYPIKSNGKELFGFAFPSGIQSYEELPEDTSLQRKLKKIYLDGEFIHAHAGFVTSIGLE